MKVFYRKCLPEYFYFLFLLVISVETTPLLAQPGGRYYHTLNEVDGSIFLSGGRDLNALVKSNAIQQILGDLWRWNDGQNEWAQETPAGPAPADRYGHSYGESIQLLCKITNKSDTIFEFFSSNYKTCQAEFSFKDFNSNEQPPGFYEIEFDASPAGSGLSSGVYFYKIETFHNSRLSGNFSKTKKSILLR